MVYAPNGTDPLPNVTVYVPNDTVQPFSAGVSCPISGSPPSGSPLVGTITDVNGKFTLVDMPVGANIPIVAVSGRWRVQTTVNTTACANTTMILSMPQNHTQGDIPLIAIATGSADQVECVLLKMGISQSEFTDPGMGGRINLYAGSGSKGEVIDSATPDQSVLMGGTGTNLNQYDVLMLPCEGNTYPTAKTSQEYTNLVQFANLGGRVYSSHYSYQWMINNPPFNSVASWTGKSVTPTPDPGTATVDTSFTAGQTLATWLQNVGASTSPGQIALNTLRIDQNGVIAPTQSWLTLNNSNYSNPVMQFVWDTPIAPVGQTVNQCGRVLFNEYHVETSTGSGGEIFPRECNTSVAMTPQEKLLEYMLFELTDEGGQPSLAPTTQDFGPEAVTYPSAPQTFTWTNNSSFAAQVSSVVFTGTNAADFNVTSNGCGAVAAGTNCTITVVFTPSLLGAESATLNVLSAGITLTATLTGTGVPGFTLTPGSLSFGNQDVGFASAPLTLTLTSNASGPLAVPVFATTPGGEYIVSQAACGSSLAALGSCQIGVTFKPAATGAQNGSVRGEPGELAGAGQPDLQRADGDAERHRGGLHDQPEPDGGKRGGGRRDDDDRDRDSDCRVQRAAVCELRGGGGSDGGSVLAEFGCGDADDGGDDGGEHRDDIAVHGDRLQRLRRAGPAVAGGGGQRLAAVAKAQGLARFPPTSQNRDPPWRIVMGHPRAAAGAAGGDGAGADQLHGQAAGGKCGVDRAGELYGDGDGDGWATEPFGDVQLDGEVTAD